MNNQKILYGIIALLVITNVATIFYLLGSKNSDYMGFRMMGADHMGDVAHWKEHDEFDSWEEMIVHMEEVHSNTDTAHKAFDYNKPVAETHNNSYDFGQITKESGIVSTEFEIENHGKQPLEIVEISTSCGCTTAEVDKKTLGQNEKSKLTVYFDPNFHEEPQGRITRSVFIKTNDPELSEMQFDIFVEILD